MPKLQYTQDTREQIIKNNTNDSTSKFSYSFSRDKRFKGDDKYCPHVAYDIKLSTNPNRKTTFGYGKRTSFKLQSHYVPSPFNYIIKRAFEQKDVGKTFGVGREKTEIGSYIEMDRLRVPGPGEYLKTEFDQSARKGYTMRPKTAHDRNYFIDDKQRNQVPGPGRYQQQTKLGRNFVSKFRSATNPNVFNSTSTRWQRLSTNPGPGTYLQKPDRYVQSIHKFDPAKSIGRQSRRNFADQSARKSFTPGPGNYRVKTDFGEMKKMRTEYE